ncbi:snf7 family protein [Colletotrichum truncatum]|uniref:Snf7 family protein n=1 Tax=Colletotrichum truncatum TaxID=5467 RepID=A0ACC3ZKZ1_COLTU|nr:snf7 family protein [Colletotrichum truncatum]KAF6799980.1 snf7 family protein [Colletotrichum truncatum]
MGDLADFLIEHDQNFRKARLPALYSDFRPQRTLNPDGFQANVNAWRQALARAAWEGRIASQVAAPNLLVVNVDEQLVRSLESKQFGRPLALGTVVREALNDKDLYPLKDFLSAKDSIYTKSWSQVPWSVVSWAAGQLGFGGKSTSGEDKLPKGQFVVIKNVETTAKSLAGRVNSADTRFDRTYTKSHFQKTFADSLVENRRLSETDVDILLVFLSRDKGLVVYDGKVVKIKGSGAEEDETSITEEDAAVSSLKELIDDLKIQTSLLSTRIDELTATAKEAVTKKNKVAAMAALRSKKLTESSLTTRFTTLGQLEDVAARIQQARDQVQLVKVMEASTGALKGLNEKVGGADRVGDVVAALREQMGEVDEIGDIIADANAAPADEIEVDDELAEMEREEREKEEAIERARKEKEAAAEKARKEAQEAKEAEEMERRLEAEMEGLKAPVTEPAKEGEGAKTPSRETAESLEKLELEERPQPQAA